MQCPLLGWATIVCMGCGLGVLFPHSPVYAVAALCLIVVAGLCLCHAKFRHNAWMPALVWTAVLACAMTLGARVGEMKADELAFLHAREKEVLTVEGWVASVQEGMSQRGSKRLEMTLRDVTVTGTDGARRTLRATRVEMRCYVNRHDAEAFQPGEWWRFETSNPRGLYFFDAGPMRPLVIASGGFSQAARLNQRGRGIARGLARVRRNVAERLAWGISPERATEVALVRAMLLGVREEIPRAVRGFFKYSGTSHIFAVSGLAVGMVVAMMMGVLRFTRLRFDRWGLVLIPGILCYGLLTGAAPSAMRACLMLTVYWLVPLFGVRVSAISVVSGTAVALIGVHPLNVLDIGFWMSFTVAAGLIVFVRLTQRAIAWLMQNREEEMLVARTWRQQLRVGFHSLCAVSFTAWAMATPISMFIFGQFVPAGMMANMVIVPLTFLVVCCAGVSLTVGLVWHQGAVWVNDVMIALVRVMRGAATFFAVPPLGALEVEWPFGLGGLLGIYLALGLLGYVLHARLAAKSRDELPY